MRKPIGYSSFVIFNAAQTVYHPVGIGWVQSSRDKYSHNASGLLLASARVGGVWVGRQSIACRMNTLPQH